jgi:hypothetical protein
VKFGVKVDNTKLFWALKKAREFVERNEKGKYAELHDYVQELVRSNPGSTVRMETLPEKNNQFHRIYICLAGCKRGFMAGCRPLVGLDGAFLKGYHGGQLMSDVGQDANNYIFVIVYMVVDVENKDNWKWFLTLLQEDIGSFMEARGWSFISYMQKVCFFLIFEI